MTFVVPGLYLIGLPFFPESPVWYMKKGREADARKAALRLFGANADVDARIEKIKHELKQTEDEEQNSKFSQTSWRALFSKEHRSRTFVAVLGLQSQNFSGGYFANTYQTYYFELIGQSDPFGLTAISSSLQFLSNLVAVCLSDVIPRRKGLIGGGTILMFWSIIIAGTSMASTMNNAANIALLAFMITWSMLYTSTVGCYGWAVAQESSSQATRPKVRHSKLPNHRSLTDIHLDDLISPCLPAAHSSHAELGIPIFHQPRSAQLGRQSHVLVRRS